ncbi:glutamine amidotransferase [Rubripirellula amarantea]|uniref:Glutamine amidotransferase n=1 Tax=Rubripirellula amarantea TaxID=2527999 RepID=A0A5C5WS15_9BACT|nr:type 1 glutamine amidotransferase [Rubripirellula amarantea]TWT53606.1 glutamine amidotransferase [Rubripirellula amarantea]
MQVLLIQHTAVDSAGVVADWIQNHGLQCTTLRLDRGDEIPSTFDADVLMSFGGPQSLHMPDLPAWVEREKSLIRHFIDNDRKVMGICLGAQMLASAMGALTYRNDQPEVGWHHITKVKSASKWSVLPKQTRVLHWHQNTFELPDGAEHLYRSEACENQGFAIGDLAVGFQFHPEVTERTIRHFLQVSGIVRKKATYVQTREMIEEGVREHRERQAKWFTEFLTQWLLRGPSQSK